MWLIDQMGERSVRYIIRKACSTSKINHAWVMWNNGSKWSLRTWIRSYMWILARRLRSPTTTKGLDRLDHPGVHDLVEYETRLNHVLPEYHDLVIAMQRGGKVSR